MEIGDAGNAADTTGDPNPAGSVDYMYYIGKFEVSRGMVERANAEGGLGITLFDLTDNGGNGPNRPATGVSWNEAARFINWLNTSQGFQAAYKFSTQPGEAGYDANANNELWEDGDLGFHAGNPFRNTQAAIYCRAWTSGTRRPTTTPRPMVVPAAIGTFPQAAIRYPQPLPATESHSRSH